MSNAKSRYFFNSQERINQLLLTLVALKGTPFVECGDSPESGFSCVTFIRYTVSACGYPADQLPAIHKLNLRHAKHHEISPLMEWVHDAVKAGLIEVMTTGEPIRPGDLLGISNTDRVYHLGIAANSQACWHIPRRQSVQPVRIHPKFVKIHLRIINPDHINK